MFFFLSKTLSLFTAPLFVICLLLLLSGVLRNPRWKKRLFWVGLGIMLFFSNETICNEVLRRWEIPATPFAQIKKQYEWGILLTGVTKSETGPTDRVYFNRGADRVTHTLQLYKLGIIKKILISGGSGRLIDIGVREADDMASALVMMGIPMADIKIEDTSRNTRENAVNSIALLKDVTKPQDCLLISSAYHLRRAHACFAKLGWPVDVFSTDFLGHYRKFTLDDLLIPHMDALGNWHVLFKEWVGYSAYFLTGYV
jgi:uncharacterized SAM-binding protein YcdF (DUF218 family)